MGSPREGTKFEVFEYTELTEGTKQLEHTFDHLRGVSSLWFGADGDEGVAGNSFGGRSGRARAAMFGDWRLDDESLVEEFEGEIAPTRSNKQVQMAHLSFLPLPPPDPYGMRVGRESREMDQGP